jgi:hypothetical protein
MKKLHKIKPIHFVACLLLLVNFSYAQEKEKPELIVRLSYYTENNSLQYLKVQTQLKADNKLQAVKDVVVQLYLDSLSAESLISKARTNEKGMATSSIPVSLKNQWAAKINHKFIAVTEASRKEDETITELEVAKAKIVMDTLNEDGVRFVTAQVLAFENGEWVPVKDVELKLGVKRLGGILKIGEDETYTTDSLGQAKGEFKLDALPADDTRGNFTLVAKVEDNDQFGNLSIEKTVPWGKYFKPETKFGQRSLWATRFRTPIWLLFMAYSIIATVWGVIIYLVVQLIKIKKLGKNKIETIKERHAEEYLIE